MYGAPEYLAPEQAHGAPIDGRADVYALGIILYRVLAGQVPFTGGSPAQVLANQRETPWRPLALANAEVNRLWNTVLVRALAKVPSERYPTAEALGAAIQTAMRQEQALASGAPSSAVAWRRHGPWRTGGRRSRPARPPPPRRRRPRWRRTAPRGVDRERGPGADPAPARRPLPAPRADDWSRGWRWVPCWD